MMEERRKQLVSYGDSSPGLAGTLGLNHLAHGLSETYGALKSYLWNSSRLAVAYEATYVDVDIVFVHGFGGHQRETWTCRHGIEKVYWWNQDYLNKDLRNIRVLVYGYNTTSEVLEHFPQTIREESKLLLDGLSQRRHCAQQNRPLVFIAHGLGGLIVKALLIHAFELSYEQIFYKDIFYSTKAVLFYGTPHQRKSQSLGKYIAQIAALSLQAKCGESLETDADLLALQLDRYKSLDRHVRNCSFYRREKNLKSPEAPSWPSWTLVALDKPLDSCVNIESAEDTAYLGAVSFIEDACGVDSPSPSIFKFDRFIESSVYLREAESLSKAKPKEAEFKFHQELGRSEDVEGLCEPYTLQVLSSQAQHYRDNLASDKALCCYRRVYLTIKANYSTQLDSDQEIGNNLDSAAQGLIHGAQILGSKTQYEEAARFLKTAQMILKQSCGEDNRATLMLSAHVAAFYAALGRLDEAERIYSHLRWEKGAVLRQTDVDDIIKKQDFIYCQRELRRTRKAWRWINVYGLLFEDENRLPLDKVAMPLARSMSDSSLTSDHMNQMDVKLSRRATTA